MNSQTQNLSWKQSILVGGLSAVLFLLVYSQLLRAGFISWDDGEVLLHNKAVHQFDLAAFFKNYYVGNYAPLTMISFAMDWALFHGNATGHHLSNLFLHFLNGILVFFISYRLFKNRFTALVCVLVFWFHPLQVETVAWVSAKNNLVYAFFFLGGFLYYLRYIDSQKKKHLLFSFLCFVLACLGKPSAICFPLCLVAYDFVFKQPFSLRAQLTKIPFFIVSVVIGCVTLYTRTEDKFINESHAFLFHERIGYAGYALLQYLYKFLIPVNLSVIYPYPQAKWPAIISGYAMILGIVFVCYRLYKARKNILVFGLLFFITNLLLVLQFVPFGEVLTADRYMYLPILGLSWVLVSLVSFKEKHVQLIAVVWTLVLGCITFKRTSVWKDSISVYADIVQKYPHSFLALNSLGAEYMLQRNYDLSLTYLNKGIHENVNYYKGYYNRGLLFAQMNRMTEALNDFNKAIALHPYNKAYVARANVYYTLGDLPKAIADAEKALEMDPVNTKANYVLATCYDDLNQLDRAMNYYNRAIALNGEDPLYYLRRAVLHGKRQDLNASLNDLNTSLALKPDFAEAYYWKGVVKVNLHQNPCEDLKKAFNLGFSQAQQPLMKYCR